MLLQVRNYLKREGLVSNQQIARAFQLDLSALEPMLQMLLRKGELACVDQPNSCKQRCLSCLPSTIQYYRFRAS